MEPKHEALMEMLRKKCANTVNFMECTLECTPYGGNDGSAIGWVITVSDYPPRGTIFITSGWGPEAFYYCPGKMSRITAGSDLDTILAFAQVYLVGEKGAISLPGTTLSTQSV